MKTIITTLLLSACCLATASTVVAEKPGTESADRSARIRAHKAKLAERRALMAKMTPEERKAFLESERAKRKAEHAVKMASMTPEEKAKLEAEKKAAKESLDARTFIAKMLKRNIEGVLFNDGKYVIMYKDGKTATVDPKGL